MEKYRNARYLYRLRLHLEQGWLSIGFQYSLRLVWYETGETKVAAEEVRRMGKIVIHAGMNL